MKVGAFHIGVAAEAFAAGQFARFGFDVSVQYGANQPGYDLVVSRKTGLMRVSVKGSQDGSWGLTQSFLTKGLADYHAAIDRWLARHPADIVFCFVQFKGVASDALPSMWLATLQEVAGRLKETAKGRGDTILYAHRPWGKSAHAAGTVDRIPDRWSFTEARAVELLRDL